MPIHRPQLYSVAPIKRHAVAWFLWLTMVCSLVFGQQSNPPAIKRRFPIPIPSDLPYDVDVQKVREMVGQGDIAGAQREFDILAWQAFLALNWPAAEDGRPDTTRGLADSTAPRVWNSWRSASSIFLPFGDKPASWGAAGTLATEQPLFRVKAAWRQSSTIADQNFQAFSGPLVDQNGKWVRYEVLVNREEFEYLLKNELYDLDGQAAFSQREQSNQVSFPVNDAAKKSRGAIEIKLAWKELGEHDDPTRFYTTDLTVTLAEPIKEPNGLPRTKKIKAGLVGMHIALPTKSSAEWIWATFEQIDNVRVNNDEHGRPIHPSFFDPSTPQPVNVLPEKNATIEPKTGRLASVTNTSPQALEPTTWIESLTTKPVQVARVEVPRQGQLNPLDNELSAGARELNAEVQTSLKSEKSVFQYYELIGTQWPVHPNAPAVPGGAGSAPESITHKTPGHVVPVFLVNTTMETYFQRGLQAAGPLEQDDRLSPSAPPIDNMKVFGTESCVGCHYSAGICIGFKKDANGNFLTDERGDRTPIFGQNSHFGNTGSANFSWLLQIEARAKPYSQQTFRSVSQPLKQPAKLLDIQPLLDKRLEVVPKPSATASRTP